MRRRRRCEPPPGQHRMPSTLRREGRRLSELWLETTEEMASLATGQETSALRCEAKEAKTLLSRRIGRGWRIPRMPSLLLLFLCLISVPIATAVKCYCTDDHCVPYGACEGNACLVGILKESNQVIRTCGNQQLGCFRRPSYRIYDNDVDDKWADLCVCSEPFCNTFSFLRQNTQKEKPHTFPQPVVASSEHDQHDEGHHQNNNGGGGNGYFKSRASDFQDDGDDHLVFHRMDRPDDGPQHNPDAPLATSFVTILLVVVPLTVGALTVVIVAFNYYCHLC